MPERLLESGAARMVIDGSARGGAGGDIYPRKLTSAPSYRVGCIGRLGPVEMRGALAAIEGILEAMEVARGALGAGLTSAGSRS